MKFRTQAHCGLHLSLHHRVARQHHRFLLTVCVSRCNRCISAASFPASRALGVLRTAPVLSLAPPMASLLRRCCASAVFKEECLLCHSLVNIEPRNWTKEDQRTSSVINRQSSTQLDVTTDRQTSDIGHWQACIGHSLPGRHWTVSGAIDCVTASLSSTRYHTLIVSGWVGGGLLLFAVGTDYDFDDRFRCVYQ